MMNLPSLLFEENKGISTSPGSSHSINPSTSSNLLPSSTMEVALPSFSISNALHSSSPGNAAPAPDDMSSMKVEELISILREPDLREEALLHLREASACKHHKCNQKTCKELAVQLWESFETAFILLLELSVAYKKLEPSKITIKESNRLCNVLALLQCMASHPEVRMELIKAKIPYYVYPLLQTREDDKPLSFIRLASLGVVGALVKCDNPEEAKIAVHFLLETEVFPLCLGCMDKGDELTQEVAIFIVVKILMQDQGLNYCCIHAERFISVVQVLTRMVDKLAEKPAVRLLKYVVRCFVRLSEAPRSMGVTEAMRRSIPAKLRDGTFNEIFHKNPEMTRMMQQLLCNVTPGLGPN